jgi:hypothetical protein
LGSGEDVSQKVPHCPSSDRRSTLKDYWSYLGACSMTSGAQGKNEDVVDEATKPFALPKRFDWRTWPAFAGEIDGEKVAAALGLDLNEWGLEQERRYKTDGRWHLTVMELRLMLFYESRADYWIGATYYDRDALADSLLAELGRATSQPYRSTSRVSARVPSLRYVYMAALICGLSPVGAVAILFIDDTRDNRIVLGTLIVSALSFLTSWGIRFVKRGLPKHLALPLALGPILAILILVGFLVWMLFA